MNTKVKYRIRFYYQIGASLLSLPIAFLGFSRNLYSLIDNLPILPLIFPNFNAFLVRGGIALIPSLIFIGYLWTKSPFYRAGFEVPAEENPYAYRNRPGKETLLAPFFATGAKLNLKLWDHFKLLEPQEKKLWYQYIETQTHLAKGGDIRELPFYNQSIEDFCEKDDQGEKI